MQSQNNVTEAKANIDIWSKVPLFERKDGKPDNILFLEDRTERVQRRYELIEATSARLATLLAENYKLLLNIPEPELVEEVIPEEVKIN